ncbi:MAG TPA: hypothetical protein V6C81_01070 [Planktothrix sp.]|jgi:hypothetical protein
MKKAFTIAYLQLSAPLLISFAALPAVAFPVPEFTADESISNTATTDGKTFAEKMRKSIDGYNDYSCDSFVYMYHPQAQCVGGGNFCFKKIDLIRLTVRSKGLKDGAVVVRSQDGRIRAKGGPKLSYLHMNLNPDSRWLQIPNGFNAIESDIGHLLDRLPEAISAGDKLKVTTEPINVPRLNQKMYVLQVIKPGDTVSEQLYVSKENDLPVEWDIFRDGKRYSVATFENFKGNVGLDDSIFHI